VYETAYLRTRHTFLVAPLIKGNKGSNNSMIPQQGEPEIKQMSITLVTWYTNYVNKNLSEYPVACQAGVYLWVM